MKYLTTLPLALLLLAASCQRTQQPEPEPQRTDAETPFADSAAVRDTLAVQTAEKAAETGKAAKQQPAPALTKSRLYAPARSRHYDEDDADEDDGMRGFDPSMEDDMDDNGMSRYMESYDDEAWD